MSNVGEAHRRALERRQIAQQTGDYEPRRLDSPTAPTAPDGTMHTAEAVDPYRNAPLQGDEGVSAPRRVEPNEASTRADANTAAFALPQAPREEYASEQPPAAAWPPVPAAPAWGGTQAPNVSQGANVPPYTPPPPRPDYAAAPPPAPGVNPERSSIGAEWEAQERQRHRGKRCANCRHFQVAESGDRGWCRNRFAFPTPQLVGPNDLACISGIGAWWAANDQWWLAKAGLPVQTGPTPLADALLEEMHEQERRRAAFRRPNTG
jgi:hypothetical protein